ncbi:STAS domain-containing protein [Duganella sp. P38]|uniref:STAS domain-containing protein n=1 Tax=Duganella sp. P38 TaxID=3423949 RepID=UPI003D78D42A
MRMGWFSLFSKAGALPPPTDDGQARLAADSELVRQQQAARLRELARATALKIDAIESAMTADMFGDTEPAWGSQRPPGPSAPAADSAPFDSQLGALPSGAPAPLPAAGAGPALTEEIVILYANGDIAAAQQLLEAAVAEANTLGSERGAWWMLFDLYQASGQQDAFDSLSIDYASTFETSPPQWRAVAAAAPDWAGLAPTVALSGVLDRQSAPQLERLRQAGDHPVLRLEFSRVAAVAADGCALLLDALRQLQARHCELIVVGAPALAARLRAGLAVGRRAGGEAPWLLLLELLRLQNLDKDFDQTAMDYCVTFEVSPPPFTPPHRVALAPAQQLTASPDRFMLPSIIERQLGPLLPAIQQYAEQYPALVFDCSRLARIDYASAMALRGALAGFGPARKIALRDVNHLVAGLLQLLGYASVARLHTLKY